MNNYECRVLTIDMTASSAGEVVARCPRTWWDDACWFDGEELSSPTYYNVLRRFFSAYVHKYQTKVRVKIEYVFTVYTDESGNLDGKEYDRTLNLSEVTVYPPGNRKGLSLSEWGQCQ